MWCLIYWKGLNFVEGIICRWNGLIFRHRVAIHKLNCKIITSKYHLLIQNYLINVQINNMKDFHIHPLKNAKFHTNVHIVKLKYDECTIQTKINDWVEDVKCVALTSTLLNGFFFFLLPVCMCTICCRNPSITFLFTIFTQQNISFNESIVHRTAIAFSNEFSRVSRFLFCSLSLCCTSCLSLYNLLLYLYLPAKEG